MIDRFDVSDLSKHLNSNGFLSMKIPVLDASVEKLDVRDVRLWFVPKGAIDEE